MTLLRLFYEFFKTGLFAVGGGLATLPFLSAMSENTGWFSQAQLADMIAVSESTPGPIGVNMATYVGFLVSGVPGALIATLGLITPSIIVILLIAAFLRAFRDNRYVSAAFRCLRPASTGLITAAGLSLSAASLLQTDTAGMLTGLQWPSVALAAALILFTRVLRPTRKWHPIVWILLSAVVGAVFKFAGA